MRDRLGGLWLPGAFLVVALFTGLLMAVVMPLGHVADEGAHATRVEALSDGQVIGARQGTMGGMLTHPTLWDVARASPARDVQTRADREAAENLPWSDVWFFLDLGTIATYFPAVYAPAAATVAASRAVGFTPAQAFREGRRVNAIVYAVIGASALLVARRGRALIAAGLLLPMSLSMAASLSADGPLIALAALAAACLTREGVGAWWGTAAALTVIGLTKLPYAALLLPLAAAAGPRRPVRIGVCVVAAGLMIGWTVYNQTHVIGELGRDPYTTGPLWPGPPEDLAVRDPARQMRVIEADPTRAVTLVTDTFGDEFVRLWREFVGVLGWLTIVLPGWMYTLWAAVLAAALLALPLEAGPGGGQALAGSLGVLGCVWAIMLAQYLGWSEVGATRIDGVQGRYFLPLLPFLAVCVPGVSVRAARWVAALPLAAGAACAVTVPVVVALACYLR